MIWQIFIDYSDRTKSRTDIIKIWAILPHDAVSKTMQNIENYYRIANRENSISKLVLRKAARGDDGRAYPNVYDPIEEKKEKTATKLKSEDGALVESIALLHKFYTLTSGRVDTKS